MPEGEATVQGYGDVDIVVSSRRPNRGRRPRRREPTRILRLYDVALCENFAVNLVSLRQLKAQGFWWDTHPDRDCIRQIRDNAIFCYLEDHLGQSIIERLPANLGKAAFLARRDRYSAQRPVNKAEADLWHLRLGHPGAEALEHLAKNSLGVDVTAPKTWECPQCAQAKMFKQISRYPRHPDVSAPGVRIGLDFHEFQRDSRTGVNTLLIITDRFSGMMWDYYLPNREAPTILDVLRHFLDGVKRQLRLRIRIIECDNEIASIQFKRVLEHRPYGIKIEPSAPNTQDQNGLAERSARYIKEKIRAMRLSSKLPEDLWTEITRAAIYCANRVPRRRHDWRSPYEVFYTAVAQMEGAVVRGRKPQLGHLRAYGCKAYAMTDIAQLKKKRLQRFLPKAWIGYLVGYNATGIYRIWIPKLQKVISTRDVIFNEEELFDGKIDANDAFSGLTVAQIAGLLLDIDAREERLTETSQPLMNEEATAVERPPGEVDAPQDAPQHAPSDSDDDESIDEALQEPPDAMDQDEVMRGVGAGRNEENEVILDEIILPDRPYVNFPDNGPTDQSRTAGQIPSEGLINSDQSGNGEKSSQHTNIYPSPPESSHPDAPPTVFLAAATRQIPPSIPRLSQPQIEPWKAAFHAGTRSQVYGSHRRIEADGTTIEKTVDRAHRDRLGRRRGAQSGNPRRPLGISTQAHVDRLFEKGTIKFVKRADLPPEPRWHSQLQDHPFGRQFEEAEATHLKSHREMRSWIEVDKSDASGHQILDCMWVYLYKFDKHGRFQKCKARLVVRGDQQAIGSEETYAATLAGRSFRALIAIAARFDLELKQFDAVNAFVNADLDEVVYMRLPPGRRGGNRILRLRKALYGLRKSPLLWQRHLTGTLVRLRCETIPQDPCVLIRNGILVFFYVDDIVFAYRRSQESEATELIAGLQSQYQLTGGDDLQWYTGIEVLRDRPTGKIWLCQSAYIDKIAKLVNPYNGKAPQVPMGPDELLPFDGIAPHASINRYQKKIGSLLWAAVNTRPDVAFAVSRLGRFSHNPSSQHHEAADRAIRYLVATRTLALQYGGQEPEEDFVIASDASFADNSIDRKSSQAYSIKIFGGLTMWSANKQDTVTTSTTEAELLALAQAAKEGFFVSRLLHALTVRFDDKTLRIQCDNQQTIRLVEAEVAQLKTKLKHVDIHNHWLRQEVENGTLRIIYTPTDEIFADGFTKALQGDKFKTFLNQIGLADIPERLEERRFKELQDEDIVNLAFGVD